MLLDKQEEPFHLDAITGALHHIICRGIEQRLIFYDDSEKGNRELGISGTKVGKKSGLSQSAASRAVQRGEQLVLMNS